MERMELEHMSSCLIAKLSSGSFFAIFLDQNFSGDREELARIVLKVREELKEGQRWVSEVHYKKVGTIQRSF